VTRDFDLVVLPDADHPEVGDTAPEFTRPLVNREFWEDVSLSTLVDSGPVLLLFHPMDWAPTAINLWTEVRARDWDDAFDVTVVGVSISTPYDHKRFLNERELDYELFSDPTNTLAEAYGVVHDLDGMTAVAEPRPAAFLLHADRSVLYAWAAEEWPAYPDYDAIEAALTEL
jgi:peroxiredoxin